MDKNVDSCCGSLLSEFQCRKFGLGHDKPSLHVTAQCFGPGPYIGWRVIWVLFFLSMLMLDIHYQNEIGAVWFTFMSNWTFLLQFVAVSLDCTVTIFVYLKRQEIRNGETSGTTWYIKLHWLLFNITNTSSLIVTIFYYASPDPEWSHGSITFHLLNSVYTLLNIFITATPVQLQHFYQPAIYVAIYGIFTLVYHVLGNDPVYEPLDWSDTKTTVHYGCLGVFIGVPILHGVVFALHSLRCCFSTKCGTVNKNIL